MDEHGSEGQAGEQTGLHCRCDAGSREIFITANKDALEEIYECEIAGVGSARMESPGEACVERMASNARSREHHGDGCTRPRRASSVRAEEKIRKRARGERPPADAQGEGSTGESPFCGLPRRRPVVRLHSIPGPRLEPAGDVLVREGGADTGSRPAGGMEGPGSLATEGVQGKMPGSPVHRQFICGKVLQDKTNSPAVKPRAPAPAKFFLEDLGFLKEDRGAPRKKTPKDRSARRYFRLKTKNTQFNGRYTTVSPRRRSVIDLYSCPKAVYRSPRRGRTVRFDLNASAPLHNSNAKSIPPIFIASDIVPSFSWDKDKEVVEIVKRLDLGSEISVEDFVFKRIDKTIES